MQYTGQQSFCSHLNRKAAYNLELVVCVLSHVQRFVTLWTVARRAPLLKIPCQEFSRQESWTGLPFSSPGDLPDLGIKLASLESPALAGAFLPSRATREAPLSLLGGNFSSPHTELVMVAFQGTGAVWLVVLAPRSPSSTLKALIPAHGSTSQGTSVLICPQWLCPCVRHPGATGASRKGQEVLQPETPEIWSGSPNPGGFLVGSPLMGRPCQSGQKHTVKVTAGGRPGAGLDTVGRQAHGRRAAATPLALAQLPSLDQAPLQSSHLLIMGVHVHWKCNCEHIAMSGDRFRYCEPDMCVHACANMSVCLPCLQSCWHPSHLGVGAQSPSLQVHRCLL